MSVSTSANFGFDASAVSSTPSFLSRPSRFSPSSDSALMSIPLSSSRQALVYMRRVMSIRRSSLAGYSFTNLVKISSQRKTSCLQYSASSNSTSGSSSMRPFVLCTARPFSGRLKSVASLARLLPTSTPRIARAIDSVSKMKAGVIPYRQHRIETSNCALWASTAVRLQSTPSTYSGRSRPPTHTIGSSLPYSWKQHPNALNLTSRMYSSVVIFDNV